MIRWVVCPVDVNGKYRSARVANLIDASTGAPYRYVAAISDGQPGQINNWCLAQVWGTDFSALDADSQVINLLEFDYDHNSYQQVLSMTLRDSGIPAAKLSRIQQRMQAKGVDTSGITLDTPLHRIVQKLGTLINPQFQPLLERTSFVS